MFSLKKMDFTEFFLLLVVAQAVEHVGQGGGFVDLVKLELQTLGEERKVFLESVGLAFLYYHAVEVLSR